MNDQIHIKDLLVRAIIGINDEERINRQDIIINITLYADTRPAAASDNIAHAVNYRTIAKNVIDFTESSQLFLVEKLAEEIARLCFQEAGVRRVIVSVEKPTALRFARTVGITIDRSRSDVT